MYKLIEDVLKSSKFELSDMLKKIKSLWVEGDISEEQKNELYALAQSKAKPENSIDVIKKLEEFEQRIKALESKSETSNETTEEYPEFVPNKWYYAGDRITFEGNKYKCTAPEGVVCVWPPKDYPTYWETVT